MKKIKGQGKLTKMLAIKIAAVNKSKFISYIRNHDKLDELLKQVYNNENLNVDVVSFSSAHDFGEQILSILSFIKYVGFPKSWTLYSDGTHTIEQIRQLNLLDFIKFVKVDFTTNYISENIKSTLLPYKNELVNYTNKSPLGKKLFFYLNHSIRKPTIFLDSDIIFYEKSTQLKDLASDSVNGWFLPDAEWGNLDSRYVATTAPQRQQINSGLILMNKELTEVTAGLEFLRSLNCVYEYFSEQTIMHILLLKNDFVPLDSNLFALNSGDQFDLRYLYHREAIAARHYTSPVRHKMWQRNWKWHLSLL